MNKADLQAIFRMQELARRDVRRQKLLNEIALDHEALSPEDRIAEAAAIDKLRQMRAKYEASTRPQVWYWKRLWLALLGRDAT